MRRFTMILTALLLVSAMLMGCGQEQEEEWEMLDEDNPLVTITMDNGKIIRIELYPDVAPGTVDNFIYLIDSGFYDGLTFHRTEPGFVIQGGDPNGNGSGGPGYTIRGEFNENGIVNNLAHTRGVVSMARTDDYNSAGSQFFIVLGNASHLDGSYAAFGMVVSGMAEVDKIVSDSKTRTMAQVTVEPNGYDWSYRDDSRRE